MKPPLTKLVHVLDRAVVLCGLPGKLAAWLSLFIIGLSVISVLAGIFRVHQFFSWAEPVFLFGTELNSTSLVELQWHLFAVMMLFAGSFTFASDRHVRVDIFYARMPRWLRLAVNALGDLCFLLPFCLFAVYYSATLVQFSYQIAEASSEMGLTHRWVVKSVLPLAMALLAMQALCRGLGGALRLVCLAMGLEVDDFICREKEDANEC